MAKRTRSAKLVAIIVATSAALGLGGWAAYRQLLPAPPAALTARARPRERFSIETLTAQQIIHHVSHGLSVIRLAEDPNVIVLDFASLAEQARMLDRVAALIEKAGLPRDRLLSPAELKRAVVKMGNPKTGFYYGHDYSAAALRRFFSIAKRDGVRLNADETKLRDLVDQLGWLDPHRSAGLISIPAVGSDPSVGLTVRKVILLHELSHGEYFSDPAYSAYVHRFFTTVLTQRERAAFVSFLGNEGYDQSNRDLIENETQAYLIFTTDPRFFFPALVNMTAERRAALTAAFLRGMPDIWLKKILAWPG